MHYLLFPYYFSKIYNDCNKRRVGIMIKIWTSYSLKKKILQNNWWKIIMLIIILINNVRFNLNIFQN